MRIFAIFGPSWLKFRRIISATNNLPFYVSRIDATTRRICDAGARWHTAGNGHLLSRRKITSGRTVVTAEMCLRSAVSTGHVVALRTTRAEAVVPRGCSETRGQVSMYTRLYVPGAQCKLIPFTGSQRVCRVVTLSSCRPHRQHFREKHSPWATTFSFRG